MQWGEILSDEASCEKADEQHLVSDTHVLF